MLTEFNPNGPIGLLDGRAVINSSANAGIGSEVLDEPAADALCVYLPATITGFRYSRVQRNENG
jgi:hypothetical protein